jgi:hypothetical protein
MIWWQFLAIHPRDEKHWVLGHVAPRERHDKAICSFDLEMPTIVFPDGLSCCTNSIIRSIRNATRTPDFRSCHYFGQQGALPLCITDEALRARFPGKLRLSDATEFIKPVACTLQRCAYFLLLKILFELLHAENSTSDRQAESIAVCIGHGPVIADVE